MDAHSIEHHRVFPESPARVFAAVRDPAQLREWWGPAGFTNEFREFAFVPGGRWRLVMRAPDGTAFENEWRFLEIVPASRIVLQHVDPVHSFTLTVLLNEVGGGTRVTWRMRFDSAEELAGIRGIIAPANEQNLDRLGAVIARQPATPSA